MNEIAPGSPKVVSFPAAPEAPADEATASLIEVLQEHLALAREGKAMNGITDRVNWVTLILVLPLSMATVGMVFVTLVALIARRPATQRYYLRLIVHMIRYVDVLRNKQ